MMNNYCNDDKSRETQRRDSRPEGVQRHVHEFTDNVKIAERDDPHNHHFSGISGEAIHCGRSHVHKIWARTDFYEDHFHLIDETTGPAVDVGGGKHVHFLSGTTNKEEGHRHNFTMATLIEDPIGD